MTARHDRSAARGATTQVVVGTGYVGARALRALPRPALGFYRSSRPDSDAECRPLDLDDPQNPPVILPASCRLLYTVPPPADGEDDPRLLRFLDRITEMPERLVYLSTTGVYGDRHGETVTENDPPAPATDRALRRLAAERALERCSAKCGIRCYVLRVPGIYGPGRLGLDRLEGGADILRDRDSGPGNRIHVDDLVRCCIAALTGDAPPGVYNLGDGDHRSSGEFSRAVARLAGLPAPREITFAEAERLWSPMRLSFARESRRADTTKMREVLGVMPRYATLEDGILASLGSRRGRAD